MLQKHCGASIVQRLSRRLHTLKVLSSILSGSISITLGNNNRKRKRNGMELITCNVSYLDDNQTRTSRHLETTHRQPTNHSNSYLTVPGKEKMQSIRLGSLHWNRAQWQAWLAQSVEHETLNLRVGGSSPPLGVTYLQIIADESQKLGDDRQYFVIISE